MRFSSNPTFCSAEDVARKFRNLYRDTHLDLCHVQSILRLFQDRPTSSHIRKELNSLSRPDTNSSETTGIDDETRNSLGATQPVFTVLSSHHTRMAFFQA
jgi:hypothetical protein